MKEPRLDSTQEAPGLAETVAALTERVALLEARLDTVAPGIPAAAAIAASGLADHAARSNTTSLGLELHAPSMGAAVLMVAGAFLLRAVTEGGILPSEVGVSLGVSYVLVLILLTHRAAAGERRGRAQLFGAATVLVAFPFVWETATKLQLLPAVGAAVVTLVFTGLGLAVVMHHRLRVLSWFVLLAAVATLSGLYWTAGAPELYLATIVAVGVATVWFGYLGGWPGPRWLTASVANVLVLVTVILAAHPTKQAIGRPQPDAAAVLPIAIALPAIYLGSFAWRTLLRRREAGLFEILQSLGSILAGYVGAIHLLRVGQRSLAALGWTTLIVALAGYTVAFALVRKRQGRNLNFFYHAWLGLLLTLIGTALIVPSVWLAILWGSLALAAAVTGALFDRWTLRLHCASYLIGATVLCGAVEVFLDAFVAPAAATWRRLTAPGAAVWAMSTASYLLLVAAPRGDESSRWRRIPRFLVAALLLIGVGSLLVPFLAGWFSRQVPGPPAAMVAVVRTAVLAGTAVLMATAARRPPVAELGWFVSPLLVVTGFKLVVEDLRRGTPISLFAGFACFGIALIMAPRLRRRKVEITP
ncbi:MAG TPA: hypothetical protein PLL30_02025 [Candidatus Krumholzibacteria bacterium]|nr:hypothetical protein [Candidatus Krumholzibacteria bacterium]HPD70544.1 hypothetical protein [Candidatus Krumholzibacteria bacterium]HRY39756.1 hypothetical protein [Candidatus Krumholzibacteria bacterium]